MLRLVAGWLCCGEAASGWNRACRPGHAVDAGRLGAEIKVASLSLLLKQMQLLRLIYFAWEPLLSVCFFHVLLVIGRGKLLAN